MNIDKKGSYRTPEDRKRHIKALLQLGDNPTVNEIIKATNISPTSATFIRAVFIKQEAIQDKGSAKTVVELITTAYRLTYNAEKFVSELVDAILEKKLQSQQKTSNALNEEITGENSVNGTDDLFSRPELNEPLSASEAPFELESTNPKVQPVAQPGNDLNVLNDDELKKELDEINDLIQRQQRKKEILQKILTHKNAINLLLKELETLR